jgi:hypothetical protein
VTDVVPTNAGAPTGISNGGTFSAGTITWNLGTLAGLSTTTLTYQVVVAPAVAGDNLVNTATVTSSTDTNAANNSVTLTTPVVGQPNLLGRWVVVSSSSYAAGTPLTDGDPVANGDVLEFQICIVGFDPNAGEARQTWDPSVIDLNAQATLFQSTDANAHPDCADTQDRLDEFFTSGAVSQTIDNVAAAVDLTGAVGSPYTAGVGRYTFTVVGTSGAISIGVSNIGVADWVLGNVSAQIIADYDFLTIN